MIARKFATKFKHYFDLVFHKRNVIIVSQQRVRHIHISGLVQCALLACLAVVIFWASFFTGHYMAARKLAPQVAIAQSSEPEESSFLFSAWLGSATDEEKQELLERVALLEKQVTELEESKADIIARVRTKTTVQIDNLERIIKQTGLNPGELRKNYSSKAVKSKTPNTGGPYIPGKRTLNQPEARLYKSLDDLATLRAILGDLPLSAPMKNSAIHSSFGQRIDPFHGKLAMHSGVDLSGPPGSRVLATADGIVTEAKTSPSYGNYIDIDHGNGITTRYAHLNSVLVHEGQKVRMSQAIGVQGSTGRSTGSHLHYEIRYKGRALNPKNFLTAGIYVLEQ